MNFDYNKFDVEEKIPFTPHEIDELLKNEKTRGIVLKFLPLINLNENKIEGLSNEVVELEKNVDQLETDKNELKDEKNTLEAFEDAVEVIDRHLKSDLSDSDKLEEIKETVGSVL